MELHGTTILCVKKDGVIAMIADGQVTYADVIIKAGAKKIKKLSNSTVLIGFSGVVADAMILSELLEQKLSLYSDQLVRAVMELCKDWRTNKMLRNLGTTMLAADKDNIIYIFGNGQALECTGNVASVGSGSTYALPAAMALSQHSNLSAVEISKESMKIAANLCIYTNEEISLETIVIEK